MKKIIITLLLGFTCAVQAQVKPVIGISDTYKDGSCVVPRSYINAVLAAGGIPVVIPLIRDDDNIKSLLNTLDGVIFTGGEDYDPAYYNERPIPQMGSINAPRDTFDIRLMRLAVACGIPVLGICRGLQLINITFGGSLYQDIPAQYPNKSVLHRKRNGGATPMHPVTVQDGTVFAGIVGNRMLNVNSAHHQAIKRLADGYIIAAKSADGIIEAIEKTDDKTWVMGVQFHPEMLIRYDTRMLNIFKRFGEESLRRKQLAAKAGNREPEKKLTLAPIKTHSLPTPHIKAVRAAQKPKYTGLKPRRKGKKN